MKTVYFAILDLIRACVTNGKKLDAIAERQEQMNDTLEEILADVTLDIDPESAQGQIDAATLDLKQTNDRLEALMKAST